MDPKRNILIGTLEVSVPPDKAGKQGAKLTFTYDLNGILLIEAVTDEDKKYELTISGKLNRISNKNIKAMKESLKNTESKTLSSSAVKESMTTPTSLSSQ